MRGARDPVAAEEGGGALGHALAAVLRLVVGVLLRLDVATRRRESCGRVLRVGLRSGGTREVWLLLAGLDLLAEGTAGGALRAEVLHWGLNAPTGPVGEVGVACIIVLAAVLLRRGVEVRLVERVV